VACSAAESVAFRALHLNVTTDDQPCGGGP
jgi:hypothetical protein